MEQFFAEAEVIFDVNSNPNEIPTFRLNSQQRGFLHSSLERLPYFHLLNRNGIPTFLSGARVAKTYVSSVRRSVAYFGLGQSEI
jgi:hypothetical protein